MELEFALSTIVGVCAGVVAGVVVAAVIKWLRRRRWR